MRRRVLRSRCQRSVNIRSFPKSIFLNLLPILSLVTVKVYPLSLDDQGPLANLEMDRGNILAQDAEEEQLEAGKEENGHDESWYSWLGQLPVVKQVDQQRNQGVD